MKLTFFSRIAAVAAILAVGLWAINYAQISLPNREHAMTELTKTLRPFCVGRFLINVPMQAESNGLSQSIMGMGMIEVEKNVSRNSYLLRADEKEAELRAKPHMKEGSLLQDVWRPEKLNATFLTYRDDQYSTEQFSMLTYLWRDNQMFTFHYGASNDGIQESKDELMRAFALIQPRSNDEIPNTTGACINHAFVNGGGYREESIGGRFDFPEYPRLSLVISTDVTERPDKEGLLARSARHKIAFDINYPGTAIRTLRSAKRTIHAAAGEEHVQMLPIDRNDPQRQKQGNSFIAVWEANGIAKSMDKPNLRIGLDYDDGAPQGKKLTEEEFLALWDAVVSSLRPRPGAF